MSKLTDLSLEEATSNGDGTYSGVRLARWLVEAVSGKPLSEDDAWELVRQAQERAKARRRSLDTAPAIPSDKRGVQA